MQVSRYICDYPQVGTTEHEACFTVHVDGSESGVGRKFDACTTHLNQLMLDAFRAGAHRVAVVHMENAKLIGYTNGDGRKRTGGEYAPCPWICPVANCAATAGTVAGAKQHLRRTHPSEYVSSEQIAHLLEEGKVNA